MRPEELCQLKNPVTPSGIEPATLPQPTAPPRAPHGYVNQRLQIQFRAPDDERCAARNSSINFGKINSIKSCILLRISTESYYDARIHEYQSNILLLQ